MLYVGGGAGMAPMRSHLYELFRTLKLVGRLLFGMVEDLKRELFYVDHFKALEKDFKILNFI